MIVQAYKCPGTGKFFDIADKNKYVKHLKRVAKKRQFKRMQGTYIADAMAKIALAQSTLTSVRDISIWLSENYGMLYKLHHDFEQPKSAHQWRDSDVATFSLNVSYKQNCSNSHSCPTSGVQNWRCWPDKPNGYPGMAGNIHVTKTCYSRFCTRALNITGVCTGSGGGGNDASYGVTVWLDDWTALRHKIETDLMFKKLRG